MNRPQPTTKRTTRRALRAGVVLAACCVARQAHAQTAPTAPEKTPAVAPEESVVTLSPFLVDAANERGYQATNTLAGTRLRTNLKDVASPVSVFTADLMRDIGATNFQEAMLYSVNVENENEFAPDDTEGESVASTTQNRVRGLSAGSQTRGFFKTNFRADTYNTERLSIASGPNSILFGIGSPAGILDATPITANLSRMTGSVSVRGDTNHGYRATLDYGLPIVKDVFAVRVAAMMQETRTFRKPEFDDERRHFFTATYRPFANTTIRGNYEHLRDHRVRARDTLMQDNISEWIALGKPLYDFSTDRWSFDNGATWANRPDFGNNWLNKGGIGFRDRVFMAGGALGGNEIQGLSWENTGLSYNRNRTLVPSFRNDSVLSTETNYYGLGDQTHLRGENYSAVVEQKILHGLHAELAYNRETNVRDQHDPLRGGLSTIQADVNYYLPYPIGTTAGPLVRNPNVGRYYIDSEYLGWSQNLDFETMRGMLSYSYNFADSGRTWLGRYNLGAMWQRETTEELKVKRRLTNTESYWVGRTNDYGINSIKSRYYLSLPGLGGDSTGLAYPGEFQMPPWPSQVGGIQEPPQRSKTDVTGKLFVAQGYLLNDDLVLTFGYRKDRQKAYTAKFSARDPVTRQFVIDSVDVDPTPNVQAGITRTFGAVYHTPLKWISLLYNRSNAFNPQGNYHDWFNQPLPPGTGKGEDVGIQLELLENKLSARITRFTNTSIDNVELDWYYEEPKWSVVANMDASWGMVSGYAERLGNTSDINLVTVDDSVRATRDFKSEGYEMELFYKPVKRLDLRLTVAQAKATNVRVVPHLQRYVESRLQVWEKYYGYPAWRQSDAVLPTPDPNWQNNPDSTGYQLLNFGLPRVEEFKAQEGSVTTRGRKWRGNLIANYRFGERLEGFSVGGACRWRSATTIGYRGKPNPLLAGGRDVPDISRPIYGKEILEFDAWLGYERRITVAGHKLNWNAQLNVRNLLNDDRIIPVAAYLDGTYTAYTRNDPRVIMLTTGFRF